MSEHDTKPRRGEGQRMSKQWKRIFRVYPRNGRARSFAYLKHAIAFAQECFVAQGLGTNDPVQIVAGSGADYHVVGWVDVRGWHEANVTAQEGRDGRAHGGLVHEEVCACGAVRYVEANAGAKGYGPWRVAT